ncbi:response regulator [Chondrinema litorale]|uniref:response regulator n=1 Tax=Chondrinema litorale TaxID=2994555 RepID=UPI002542D84C|nr:response regulator [Chondrinema litorale]UZR99466.1 response regulator [Chondrinema litorale]
MKKVNCIMLVDDNPDDNFFHERIIKKSGAAEIVITKETGYDALEYLKLQRYQKLAHPQLIFLDINMPGMNGWEFIEEYNKLEKDQQGEHVIVMLTTSKNPDDKVFANKNINVTDFKSKPLTKEILEEVIDRFF